MQLGDFSCCAYIWALISSLYCTLTLPTILCNAQLSHWIVISLCDCNTLVSVLWVYIYGTNLHLCVLAAELSLNAEVTELLNECERPDLVQSLLLPEDLALRHLPALGVAHRRLDFSRRNPSLSPLQEVQALRLIHAHQIKCRLKTLEGTKVNCLSLIYCLKLGKHWNFGYCGEKDGTCERMVLISLAVTPNNSPTKRCSKLAVVKGQNSDNIRNPELCLSNQPMRAQHKINTIPTHVVGKKQYEMDLRKQRRNSSLRCCSTDYLLVVMSSCCYHDQHDQCTTPPRGAAMHHRSQTKIQRGWSLYSLQRLQHKIAKINVDKQKLQ